MVVGGWFAHRRTTDFLDTAALTTGVLIGHHRSTDSNGEAAYYPVVRFEIEGGNPVEFRSSAGSSSAVYAVGTEVSVLHDLADLSSAQIDSFFSLWLATIILFVLGAGLSAAGAGGVIHFWKVEKKEMAHRGTLGFGRPASSFSVTLGRSSRRSAE